MRSRLQRPHPRLDPLLSDEDLPSSTTWSARLPLLRRAGRPTTGQVLDRATNKNTTGKLDSRIVSSIAATGFGLTALCIADKRKLLPQPDRSRTGPPHPPTSTSTSCPTSTASSTTSTTSKPASRSSTAKSPRSTPPSSYAASSPRAPTSTTPRSPSSPPLYNRVDWPWMLNGGKTFSMGWRPRPASSSALGPLLRADDALPARHRLAHAPRLRLIWNAWTRPAMNFGLPPTSAETTALRPPVQPRLVRLPRQARRLRRLLRQLHPATRAHQAFCLA